MNVNVWDVNDDLRAVVGRQVPPERLADDAIPLTELA
jgi:3-phenylpropionate/trans-cinnamate dioxygenase ferredoxin reductase component